MASNIHLNILDKQIELHRYPEQQKNRSLQAWDSADEYLIQHLHENGCINTTDRLLIINDQFGALACTLAEYDCSIISDSLVSHKGILQNVERNNIERIPTLLSPLAELQGTFDIVLVKIPKQLDTLKATLTSILPNITENTLVIGAGKAKDIHTSTLKQFESCFEEVKTSLAVKKSRLVFANNPRQNAAKPYAEHQNCWDVEDLNTSICNLPNIFSGKQLDLGARVLMQHLPRTNAEVTLIDLGCGNGVLGLALLRQCPNAQVHFVDESFSAVATARMNVERIFPEDLPRCHFSTNDCLEGFTPESADWVICNPPFHQQSAITDHIARQMFTDAKKVLNKSGQLLIVGNSHLDHLQTLKRLFSKAVKIKQTNKFTVLLAATERLK